MDIAVVPRLLLGGFVCILNPLPYPRPITFIGLFPCWEEECVGTFLGKVTGRSWVKWGGWDGDWGG